MKLEINTDNLYETLRTPYITSRDEYFGILLKQLKEGESWKETHTRSFDSNFKLVGTPVPLPSPFISVTPYSMRLNDSFSACLDFSFRIESKDKRKATIKVNTASAPILEDRIGNSWIPTDNYGAGYILHDKIPTVIIGKEYLNNTRVFIGEAGLPEIKIGSFEEFCQEITKLESASNIYLNACLDAAVKLKTIKENPNVALEVRFR